jgi:glyoxylase-like metal-dependent hydrolase (beta-lactamase superfamily II)
MNKGRPFRTALLIGVAVLLSLAGAAWLQRPDGRLWLTVLPVPGDALLIRTPAGRHVLIDGGRDPGLLALLLGRSMPYWQRDLQAVILTRGDGQRLPGQVAVLSRYQAALALAPPDLGDHDLAGQWRRLVVTTGARVAPLRAGQRLELDGATLEVVAANPGKHGGAVLLLRYGRTRALVHTGGPEGDAAIQRVAVALAPLDLLVYPWQRPLDTAAIAALRPRAIVFSQAYEAPAPALLSYADRRRYASQLYHPKNDGAVSLISTGSRAWIETTAPLATGRGGSGRAPPVQESLFVRVSPERRGVGKPGCPTFLQELFG